jgi:hypothetical protein
VSRISDRASCLSLEAAEKYGSRKAMIVSRNELGGRAMGRSGVSCAFVLAVVAGNVKNITRICSNDAGGGWLAVGANLRCELAAA